MYIVYIKIHIDENTLSLIKSPLASDFKPIEAKLKKKIKINQQTNSLYSMEILNIYYKLVGLNHLGNQ